MKTTDITSIITMTIEVYAKLSWSMLDSPRLTLLNTQRRSRKVFVSNASGMASSIRKVVIVKLRTRTCTLVTFENRASETY